MAGVTGNIEFYTGTMTETHDLRITVQQDFEVVHGEEGFETVEYGKPEVCIYAGAMILWVGKPEEMTPCWIKDLVDAKIKAGDWGIEDTDLMDAIAEDAEALQFAREHAAGMI
jgi:hypothetical protein